MTSRRVSPQGLTLIKDEENFSSIIYFCPAGKPTYGYGHVQRPTDRFVPPISEAQGLEILIDDLAPIEIYLTGVLPDIPQCQFDALASFALNAGLTALDDSTLLRLLKAGDVAGAANEFGKWVHAHVNGVLVEVHGLVNRRGAEREFFLGETP